MTCALSLYVEFKSPDVFIYNASKNIYNASKNKMFAEFSEINI